MRTADRWRRAPVRHRLGTLVVVLITLTACTPSRSQVSTVGDHELVTRRDSVQSAWRLVYAYSRAVDHIGRPRRELPSSLSELGGALPQRDVWGSTLRYLKRDREFEVRSAGSDGVFETADDVVAKGRLGRDRPCEVRDEFGVWVGDSAEPRCSEARPVAVLDRCPALVSEAHRSDRQRGQDTILWLGSRLVRIARAIDGIGRDYGALPNTLEPVPSLSRLESQEIGDAWGRPIRYRKSGAEFEVRSAGPDGVFDSDDDLSVAGELGANLPCEFRNGPELVVCEIPPPPCERASGIE